MGCGSSNIAESKEIMLLKMNLPPYIIFISKSITKIESSNKTFYGVLIGFSKVEKDYMLILTNKENITEEMIDKKEDIKVLYDNESKSKKISLNRKKRIIKDFSCIGIDILIIELLPSDSVEAKYFLLPKMDDAQDLNNFENKEIIIMQYPSDQSIYSDGKIEKINMNFLILSKQE